MGGWVGGWVGGSAGLEKLALLASSSEKLVAAPLLHTTAGLTAKTSIGMTAAAKMSEVDNMPHI